MMDKREQESESNSTKKIVHLAEMFFRNNGSYMNPIVAEQERKYEEAYRKYKNKNQRDRA